MANHVKRRFTVDLEISMGDAEKKIKGTVGNIKTILADLGKASDKMDYFKELADYLSQVDAELDRFKTKHGNDLFNQMFGGLDESLRKEMEDVFNTARAQLTQLESIRTRFNKMKADGATEADLKPLEHDLKELYKSLGKLDEAKISGRGALETRLKKMEDALENFAVVWDGVNKKVSKGLNFGGSGSGVGTGAGSAVSGISQFSDDVQQQIDRLNKQIEELEDAKSKLSKVYKIADQVQNKYKGSKAIPDAYMPELTAESIESLISEFDSLRTAMESGDKSSAEYYTNLTKIAEVALKLQKAMGGLREDDNLRQSFIDNGVYAKLTARREKTDNVLKEVLGIGSSKIKPVGDLIQANKAQISTLTSGNNDIKQSNDDVAISYDELKNKVKEYIALIKETRKLSANDPKQDTLLDDMDKLSNEIAALTKNKALRKQIRGVFTELEQGGIKGKEAFEQIAKLLNVTETSSGLEQANLKLKEFLSTAQKLKGLTSLEGIDAEAALSDLRTARDELKQLQEQGAITEQQMRNIVNAFDDAKGNLYNLGQGSDGSHGAGSGFGTGAGGTITDIDFSDLKDTIKSEASSLASKLDNVLKVELVKDDTDIQGAISNLQGVVEKISGAIDSYNSLKETSAKQAEVDAMKANLTQLLKYVSDFNSRQIGDQYQGQELSASVLSDGSISMGYGEKGKVPWNRVASNLVANLNKSLLMDIHSHPLHKVKYGKDTYVSDAFSGSEGDLAAFGFSKKLGAQISAMITGNILRTIDLSKLTDHQMGFFRAALSEVEKKYVDSKKYEDYIGRNGKGELVYHQQYTQEGQHRVTQIFESMMYDAFAEIGLSRKQVDNEIFRKYNLTDEQQLTEAAEKLVQLSSAAQSALSPVQRLTELISAFHGDSTSSDAQNILNAYEKGELTAAEAFNRLTPNKYHVNQETMDSLYKIDTANEISAVESLLTQITGILNTISSSVSSIESSTRQSTSDQFDTAINDIFDLRENINTGRLTAGVKSIYDPFNVTKYKSKEVYTQADASILDFKDFLRDIYSSATDYDFVNIDEVRTVFEKFRIAMSNVQDAIKQNELYEERTNTSDDDNGYAVQTLKDEYNELIDISNLDKMMRLLSMSKAQLGTLKNSFNYGSFADADEADVGNIDLVIGSLQSIQSMLESIYGVLHGFTGIEADAKNAVKYSKPTTEAAVASRGLSDQDLSVLNSILQSVQDINAYLHTDNVDDVAEKPEDDNKDQLEQSSIYQLLASKLPGNVASEDTLSSVRDLLAQLVAATTAQDESMEDEDAKTEESLGQLVVTLTSAVKSLQDATNGIIQHQKATKTDTSVANARIADKNAYSQIKSVALNALGDRAIDSEVTEMKALANGIVQVIGYLQVAENEWEGFTLQVNEANEVSKLAFDKNSKAAKRAAAEAEALRKLSEQGSDENRKAYSKEETARRAQVHLDEYTAQGKNATVQLKDSGRYTISILEEIGGLSKQIFQTFDENDEKIERTTATMSNKVLVKLQDLKKIIEFGRISGFVGYDDDVYKRYVDASADLTRLNIFYRDEENLADEDIASWNTQIKLVQQLGAEVEKLILKRKTASSSEVFNSKRGKEVSKFDYDYENLKQSIAIPDSFIQRINDARNAISNAVDNESLDIAKNKWASLCYEIKATAEAQDLYIHKAKTVGTASTKAYGTTPINSAQKRFNELSIRAQSYSDSTVVNSALEEYKKSFEELIALWKTFEGKSEKDLTSDQIQQFTKLKVECDNYGRSLKKIIDSSDKLRSNSIKEDRIFGDVSVDNASDRAKALRNYVDEFSRGKAHIQGFNGDATALTFTLKKADGTIETMTASLDAARTAIILTSQGTKQATSVFDGLAAKFKELWRYAAARFGVDEIFQAVRTGIQYVRDIDSALTELKKVTDETDGAYDRFLQNMSKTAGVVGSTVSELTTMAAEWSRLGYSMEESATLAKNTAILLNVSEFDDATEASEALISTMQAFQYTADESGHVVDILNEIGNNYAVSSDGIAVALQDSASALMEAGNSLEQATALVASANKVVQDPNSVGKIALPTLKVAITVKS